MRFILLLLFPVYAWALNDVVVECAGANPCEPVPIVGATGYFVDCAAGNDQLNGITQATAWRTLAKATSSISVNGSDLWVKNNCQNQRLLVRWPGTANDRVVVGSYYVSNGVAYANTPTGGDVVSGYVYGNGPRATIDGTYEPTCRPNCAVNSGTALPTNSNLALVEVHRNQYVTIQDIEIKDSAGKGILADPFNSDPTCYGEYITCDMNVKIQRVKVHHIAYDGIAVIDSAFAVVRDSEVAWTDLAGQMVDSRTSGFGAGIFMGRGINIRGLIENNYVHDCGGECIGVYFGTHVLIRANLTANGSRIGIYAEGSRSIVIEQNTVLGGLFDGESIGCVGPACTTPVYGGIVASTECQPSAVVDQMNQITIRNNIVANATGGITYATQFCAGNPGNPPPRLVNASGRVHGNTVINATNQTWLYNQMEGGSPTIHASGIDIANSFFSGGGATGNAVCNNYTGFTRRYSFSRVAFSDGDCVGTGDVVSTNTGINSSFPFSSASKTNIPTYMDFRPTTSSAAQGAAVVLASTFITGDWSYPRSESTTEPCGSTKLSDANWFVELWGDYCNDQRVTPIMGALNAQ